MKESPSSPSSPALQRRRWVRWAGVGLALVVLYALLAGWVLPRILRSQAEQRLAALTGSAVHIGRVTFHPFALRLGVENVKLASTPDAQPLVALGSLTANLQASSLWRGEVFLRDVTLSRPELNLRRATNGAINLVDWVERVRANLPADTNAPSGDPFPVTVARLAVTNAAVRLRDVSVKEPVEIQFDPWSLHAENLTTTREEAGRLAFEATGDQGQRVEWEGSVQIVPVIADGTLRVHGMLLAKFAAYVDAVSTMAPTSGLATVEVPFRFHAATNGVTASVARGRIELTQFTVIESTNRLPVISAELMRLEGIDASLADRSFSIEAIHTTGGVLHVRRKAGGSTNLRGMIEPEAVDEIVDNLTDWRIQLKEVGIRDYRIAFEDPLVEPAVAAQLDSIELTVRGASNQTNAPPTTLELGARIGETGQVRVTAEAKTRPARASAEIHLDELNLEVLRPYLAQALHLELTRGMMSTHLKAGYGREAADASLVRASGSLVVSNVAAVDTRIGSDFIRWDAIELQGLDAGMGPNRVALEAIIARQLQTSLIILSNGQLNVLQLIRQARQVGQDPSGDSENNAPEKAPATDATATQTASVATNAPPATDAGTAAPEWPLKIGRVQLDGVGIFAADNFFGAGFKSTVESIDGEVRNISIPAESPAEIDLKGRLTALSGFTLAGQVTPNPNAFATDLKLAARNADLTQFTPYSLRFAGYPIARGKLTADVHYRVTGDQLEATNDLVIDQITLGAKTPSPEAINIPLKLGIALLKDREGKIHLNVPLSGSLNDPQFRIGPIIGQAFRNILTKAVTAPFALLGSLFGSSEDLEFVEFQPGSPDLAPAQTNRVVTLARALQERPQLQLEILPAFDATEDRRALAMERVDARLKNLRLEEYATQGTATTVVRLTAEDRTRLIPALYAREFGSLTQPQAQAQAQTQAQPQPAEPAAPRPQGLSVEQMTNRLLETTSITPDDLKALAQRRAESIQAFLTTTGGIEPERLVVTPDDPENPAIGKSRVAFRLQ